MADRQSLQAKLKELAERKWDLPAIEARCRIITKQGIPGRELSRDTFTTGKQQILDRVQWRAEEYNFFAGNCARSAALAVMEEFGLGNMEVIKALSPFPGYAGTGGMCGGVTGGLVAVGLYCGSEDLRNQESMRSTMAAAKWFMKCFEEEVGAVTCRKIQEDVIFGRYMDPGASPENMKAFAEAKGFEKCSLLPGIGARIAAEIIIDSILDADQH
jgi:C_GCAxxG_C_C family probable redox protein